MYVTRITYSERKFLLLQRSEHGSNFLISMTSTGLYKSSQNQRFLISEFHVMTITDDLQESDRKLDQV